MSGTDRRKMLEFRRKGNAFSLLEMVVVIAILAILATVAVRSLSGVEDQSRFDITQQALANIQSAIDGDRGVRQPGGQIIPNGFVNDIGRLPNLFGDDASTELQELWQQPSGVPAYAIQQWPNLDSDLRMGIGWHGPYLQLPLGQTKLLDGWGNNYAISVGSASNGIPSSTTPMASIQSLGSGGVSSGSATSDPYAGYLPASPLQFLSTDYSTTVTCMVIPSRSGPTPAKAKLFQPGFDPNNGSFGVQSLSVAPTASNGEYIFSFGGNNGNNVSPGARIIRIYSDVSATLPMATRYVTIPKGGLAGYVIDLSSAATQPSTQPSN